MSENTNNLKYEDSKFSIKNAILDKVEGAIDSSTGEKTITLDSNLKLLGSLDISGATYSLCQSPEWIKVLVDSQERIIAGVRTDGSVYIGQLEGLDDKLQEMLNAMQAMLDEVEAEIDAKLEVFNSVFNIVDNPEWIQVTTDSEGKILEGITSEGKKKVMVPQEVQGVETSVIDNPEWIEVKTDSEGKIIYGIDKNGKLHVDIAKDEHIIYEPILLKGLIPTTQDVQALYGNDAPVVSADYDQFGAYIDLWDNLLTRANQYGTYVQKCWIDGTAYDDTDKVMSDLPTTGTHNPRGDMNQYPLIMYKFIPNLYRESYKHKQKTIKVLIVSGIHGGSSGGDHWESPMAVYYFAKRLIEEFYLTDSLAHLRNFVEFNFVPAANPWGLNNLQRVNGQNIDINRDFINFRTITAQQIKALVDNGSYDLFWDSHCLGGTSLTEGDLAGANFYWISSGDIESCIGRQMLEYIGAKYSIETGLMSLVVKSAAWYAYVNGVSTVSTEIPANTPLYYGDTVGDVHGEEVMKRGADFIQNSFVVVCDFILKNKDK